MSTALDVRDEVLSDASCRSELSGGIDGEV
jgi:hypothetical protein